MSADPIAVLSAIVAEVAGAGQPFSADSYLPPHLIHDAREAIESAVPAFAQDAHELSFVGRIQKAEKTIAEKNHEIELCHQEQARMHSRINSLQAMNGSLQPTYSKLASDSDESHSGCEAHAQLLLARMRKADETIVALRSEIDHLRRSAEETERNLAALAETNAELDRKMESSMSKRIPGCPPESLPNTVRIVFDPYERLTAYGRRQECDA